MKFITCQSILAYLLAFLSFNATAQKLEKKLIVSDKGDSLLIKADPAFDMAGNYCFETKATKDGYYYITKNRSYGPYRTIGGQGNLSYTGDYEHPDEMYFYRNTNGMEIFGPIRGAVNDVVDCDSKSHVAFTTTYKDSNYYYYDNHLMGSSALDKWGDRNWCAYSNNGNIIYYLKKGSQYKLFINQKLIDSDNKKFTELKINDHGDYSFVSSIGFHHNKTIFKEVYNFSNFYLPDNKSFHCTSSFDDYLIIDNKLYDKDIDKVGAVHVADDGNYIFNYSNKNGSFINANGKIYPAKYEKIFSPTIDAQGNFAFMGLRNYYLYRNVSGKEDTNPISRYGVRGIPLNIDATGKYTVIFQTDDSVYLCKGNDIMFKTSNDKFRLMTSEDYLLGLPYAPDVDPENKLALCKVDSSIYILCENSISKKLPTPLKTGNRDERMIGIENQYGFCCVFPIAKGKFMVDVNNKFYYTVDADKVFSDSFFLTRHTLVFYARESNSFYQYKLSL
jgi:hypothetical protein